MSIIMGNDLVVKIDEKNIFHATSHQCNIDANFAEYETKDTNGKQNVLIGCSGTATTDGLVNVGDTAEETPTDAMDTPAVADAVLAGKKVTVALNIGNKIYITDGWITNLSLAGPVAANGTYSLSVKFNKLNPQA